MKVSLLYFVPMCMIILQLSFQCLSSSSMSNNVQPLLPTHNTTTSISTPTIDANQERIDTIIRAFKHLPDQELLRLNVDLNTPILHGTPQASHLIEAWNIRQKELKEAMSSIIKPAEYMNKILQMFTNSSVSVHLDEKLDGLKQLEGLLSDIDNARDFHTIGGWPILSVLLYSNQDLKIQILASWAIGSAVKSSYEYQLWLLESIPSAIFDLGSKLEFSIIPNEAIDGITTLQMLLDLLHVTTASLQGNTHPTNASDDLIQAQKRSLYAISSGLRGNVDIQERILKFQYNQNHSHLIPTSTIGLPFLDCLSTIAVSNRTTPDVMRKVWSLVSDLLEERDYIQKEMLSELFANKIDTSVVVDEKTQGWMSVRMNKVQKQLMELELLGNQFIQNHTSWIYIAIQTLSKYTKDLLDELTKMESDRNYHQLIDIHASVFSILKVLNQLMVVEKLEVPVDIHNILKNDLIRIVYLKNSSQETMDHMIDIINLSEEMITTAFQ